ncbi:Aste57867_11688 [Aphanomyces stellatus]|uniref:Aste57867_11688 protein n=1 Tax=Aphanomyces stellatus TaxID=120398 RepID=A0A485KTP8_9STRA|nr:hypothetical protein As57867_011645 [Aphanomyces stellatus]VFT88545.1 Aste57867_11688 [Aphanomyces stellatus]
MPLSRMPPELLVKIALYIPDAPTMFNLFEALGKPDARGLLLNSLWRLGLKMDRKKLWPVLSINGQETLDPSIACLMEIVMGMYVRVSIDGGLFDLLWLRQQLHPQTGVELINPTTAVASASAQLDTWYTTCADMRITRLLIDFSDADRILPLLPKLRPHLVALHLDESSCGSLSTLMDFISSSNLTDLILHVLSNDSLFGLATLTPPMVRHLVRWLRLRPIQNFQFSGHWVFAQGDDDGVALQRELFAGLFDNKGLRSLHLTNVSLDALDPSLYGFPLRALELVRCDMPLDTIHALAKRLELSDIPRYHLRGCNPDPERKMYNFQRTRPVE